MKKIAAVTMARNDEFFLSRWIAYYGRELGRENLYVLLDGEEQQMPPDSEGVNVTRLPHIEQLVAQGDRRRIGLLNDLSDSLFEAGYDLVIGGDADEFLAVDGRVGMGLAEYLSSRKIRTSLSGLGLDVGQKLGEELPLDRTRPFLEQRRYALLSTRYTKGSVKARSGVRWGAGFHRIKGHNFHIDKNLYLFHFGCVDEGMILSRFVERAGDWSRHIHKRMRTIRIISSRRAREGYCWLRLARRLQRVVRPPYALNKPAMFGIKMVVKIPLIILNSKF